jgi:hypothetical protein
MARLFGDFSGYKRVAYPSWWCLTLKAGTLADAIGKATVIALFRYVVFPTHAAQFTRTPQSNLQARKRPRIRKREAVSNDVRRERHAAI